MKYLGLALLVLFVIACGEPKPPPSFGEMCDAEKMRSYSFEIVSGSIVDEDEDEDDAYTLYGRGQEHDGRRHVTVYENPDYENPVVEIIVIAGVGEYIRRWTDPEEWGVWSFEAEDSDAVYGPCDVSSADDIVFEDEEWIRGDRTWRFRATKSFEELGFPHYRSDEILWVDSDGRIVRRDDIMYFREGGDTLHTWTLSDHGREFVIEEPEIDPDL